MQQIISFAFISFCDLAEPVTFMILCLKATNSVPSFCIHSIYER